MFFKIAVILGGAYLIYRSIKMDTNLKTAIDGLTSEVAESNGKLASIKTFVRGVPALVAAAVAEALANANVDSQTAVDQVNAARDSISENVDATLSAIDANPAPEDTGTVAEPDDGTGTGGEPVGEGEGDVAVEGDDGSGTAGELAEGDGEATGEPTQ